MFVELPVYFAIGAAFGFGWSRYRQVPVAGLLNLADELRTKLRVWKWGILQTRGASRDLAGLFAFALAVVGAGLWLWLAPVRFSFALAVLLVGAGAGRWFANSDNGRDKMIFLGGASLLMILAALEYDRKILDGISKVNAGGISVEFAVQRPLTDTAPAFQSGLSSPFVAAGRLDIAILIYQRIGDFIDRDQKYARVFAVAQPGYVSNDYADEQIDSKLLGFRTFVNFYIHHIADLLYAIQEYQRSEESTLTVDPTVIRTLRQSYERASHSLDPNVYLEDGASALESGLMKLCDRLQLELYAIASPTNIDDACPSARIEFPDVPLAAQSASSRTPSALATVAKDEIDDSYGYLAYLAIAAAVGEYAFGNYENAIQLLDREIERQQATPAFAGTTPPKPQSCAGKERADADACTSDNRKRLYWFRRLFVISRLELVENYLFQYSEALATYPVQIFTLLRMIRHYDAMFEHLEADAITNRGLFVGALAANPGAKCASSLSGDPESMQALATIAYSRIGAENSLVWIAATNPEIVLANTDRIDEFDRYADEVADFDADCLPKMMVTDPKPMTLRWRNLDTVAAYWEAKGHRFGVRIDDEQIRKRINSSDAVEIRALCKAAKANFLAQRAARLAREGATNSPPRDDETFLDRTGASYFRDAYVARLERAPMRINAALRGYPQAEIDAEKECADAPLQP